MIPNDAFPPPATNDRFTFFILVTAIVALCALAAASVVAIMAFHVDAKPGENLEIVHVVLGVIVPAITALLALALYNVKAAVTRVHVATNGRITELLELTRSTAHAAGVVEGRGGARH